MATAESIKSKIESLIDFANAATGKADADLTAAVSSLIAGYGSGGGNGLSYDMGEFVLDVDKKPISGNVHVNHNLGEKPGFVLVWTDDYVGVTNPDTVYATSLGFVWMNKIMGLDNWYSSSVSGEGTTVNFTQSKGSTGMNVVKPTSSSYAMYDDWVTSEYFSLSKTGGNDLYRAGITYKYFVSKAWWNVGGVAIAE